MKYQVRIQYTNPAHEHVSLRRRIETVNRLVEASTEQEALNRAANQQRALGFMIKEASIVKKPEVIKEEVEQIVVAEESEFDFKVDPPHDGFAAAVRRLAGSAKVRKQAGTLAAKRNRVNLEPSIEQGKKDA